MSKMKVNRIENTSTTAGGIDINTSGNVGIGTSSPTELLEIKGVNPQFVINGTSTTDAGIEIQNNGTKFAEIKLNTSAQILDIAHPEASGQISFSTGASGTERLRIDSSGNVEIGTGIDLNADGSATFAGDVKIGGTLPSAPNISLNADGSAEITRGLVVKYPGTGGAVIQDWVSADPSADTVKARLYANGTFAIGGANVGSSPVFRIGGLDGSVALGGNAISSPNITLNANGRVEAEGYIKSNTYLWANSDNGYSGIYNYATATSPIKSYVQKSSSGTESITLYYDGSATFAGQINGTTVGTSDTRFKENITSANPQLDDVVALGGLLKNFDWNEDAPVNEEIRATRQLGLIAQEAETICPGIVKTVSRTKDGEEITPAELDEEGNVTAEAVYEQLDDSYKGISHDALIMKLLGAVADLTAKVEALENA